MPDFVAEDPRVERLAQEAWRHATACAGREAPAEDLVPVLVADPGGDFAGTALTRGGRLASIRVREPTPRTLAHEVAHAWVHGGPPALVEGATDLLAACIAQRAPEVFPAEPDEAVLLYLEDLRTWSNPARQAPARRAGYAASRRMFQVLTRAVPAHDLWRSDWTWEAFDALLAEAGPTGEAVRGVLDAGVAAQRAAFGDPDGDGRWSLEEALDGTDPARRDSDGDGWWDGAPDGLRATAQVIGAGRDRMCTGRAAGPLGALVRVEAEAPSGRPLSTRLFAGDRPVAGDAPFLVPPGASLTVENRSDQAGWVRLSGEGLVPDDRCWADARWTVVATSGAETHLAPFVAALLAADAAADRVLAPAKGEGLVVLGEGKYQHGAVRVPGGWLDRGAAGEWPYVAAYVVASRRGREGALAQPDVALSEAVARDLVAEPPETYLAALDEADVAAWAERAAACGAWGPLLRGDCGP